MRIRKYDFDYGRRMVMEKAAKGIAAAGVLSPLWPVLARGDDISKAYPDEMLSIEQFTKGKLSPGDVVDANNVEVVKDLLDPITYMQIKDMGRRIRVRDADRTADKLYPHAWLEATLRNQGRAGRDGDGNVIDTKTGGPWLGGTPFPEPKNAEEIVLNQTMSWSRHNTFKLNVRTHSLGRSGEIEYQHDFLWFEHQVTSRTDDGTFRDWKDRLRHNTILFTSPADQAGASFLNIWPYDQREFPDLHGYIPAFQRVRQFPTDQRFEPVAPGLTLYLSDVWQAGDPGLTWGNYRVVSKGPTLAPGGGQYWPDRENEEFPRHGGPEGTTFMDTWFELVPESWMIVQEPVAYPRAPVGERHVGIDPRNSVGTSYVTYDRSGKVWKQYELGNGWRQGLDEKGQYTGKFIPDPDNLDRPVWCWLEAHVMDTQTGRMTTMQHVDKIAGTNTRSEWNHEDEEGFYQRYMTTSAIARLGSQ